MNDKECLFYIVNNVAKDSLATRGTKTSEALVFIRFFGIFRSQHQKGSFVWGN